MLTNVTTHQIAVRLEEQLLEAIDRLVGEGVLDSRADAVRRGLELLLEADEQRRLDQAIVAGYRRVPQEASGDSWALAALRESIGEEPW